ncbi:uncharacterized protein [Magallana gigas]|uniref:uncharacterized protein n=1 Tax=Magallana gigas TaxID=29159 RepID=UPI003340C372
MMLAPSRIYYSQDSISNKFGKSTKHAGVLIGETLDKLLTGECSIHDIKTIQVLFRNGRYLTADNRRLWIFKKLEELGECTEIPIRMTRYINPQKNVTGSTIRVRGNPGGHLWRTWNDRPSSSTERNSDLSESDNQLLMSLPRMSLSSEVTKRLPPSKLYYSESHIRCQLPELVKDIKMICNGQFPYTGVELKVYQYDDKYCALDNEMLWKLRVGEKFQKCSYIKFHVVAIPSCTSNSYFSEELHIESERSSFFFDFSQTIRELPTLETVHLELSKISYSASFIPDHYNGKSIVSSLADFMENQEALLVVKNGDTLYTLENRKLWIHKQISKIKRQPQKITVHIKMEMDSNMLRYFTSNFISPHSTAVKFMEVYPHLDHEKTFFDFLQRDDY